MKIIPHTLPRSLRQAGTFQLEMVVGEQTVRLPRLNGISRKALTLGYIVLLLT
jgi:hypothetical protein